jgi:hypothetical protein
MVFMGQGHAKSTALIRIGEVERLYITNINGRANELQKMLCVQMLHYVHDRLLQFVPNKNLNDHDAAATSSAFFTASAAKLRCIAASVNCFPVTTGYFFSGPWISQSVVGWLKKARL